MPGPVDGETYEDASGETTWNEVALEGRIGADSAQDFRRQTTRVALAMLASPEQRSRLIRIVINSRGGSFTAGNAIVSQIRRLQASGLQVEAFVAGDCESMAAVVASACDRTIMSRTGRLMWHGLHITRFVGDENMMAARLAELSRQNEMVLELLLARARRVKGRRHPLFSNRKQLAVLLRADLPNWLRAEQALEAGLIDEVGEPPFEIARGSNA